jgi:hypothetical protein
MNARRSGSLFLVAVLVVACDAQIASRTGRETRREHERISRQIKELGGTTAEFNTIDLDNYNLPKEYRGLIGSINFPCVDLAGVDFEPLIPHRSLEIAYFTGSTIDDDQIRPFRRCAQLQEIALDSANITDAGLKAIAEIPTLEFLYLDRCRITDAGLKHLHACRRLTNVALVDTHVTEEGVRQLREKLPGIELSWSTVPSEAVRTALAQLERSGAGVASAPAGSRGQHGNTQQDCHYCVYFSWEWTHHPEVADWLKTVTDAERTRISFNAITPRPTRPWAR